MEWEKQVGPLAVKAKYRVLQYLDQKVEADERERLKQLSSDLEKLAREPDYRHLPVHAPIPL